MSEVLERVANKYNDAMDIESEKTYYLFLETSSEFGQAVGLFRGFNMLRGAIVSSILNRLYHTTGTDFVAGVLPGMIVEGDRLIYPRIDDSDEVMPFVDFHDANAYLEQLLRVYGSIFTDGRVVYFDENMCLIFTKE